MQNTQEPVTIAVTKEALALMAFTCATACNIIAANSKESPSEVIERVTVFAGEWFKTQTPEQIDDFLKKTNFIK